MKTQISELRSGAKGQILNPQIDYSLLPKATCHTGHAGTPRKQVNEVWEKVISENPNSLKIEILGFAFLLRANWTRSGKTVSYHTEVTEELFKISVVSHYLFGAQTVPYIAIYDANTIVISNGKGFGRFVCPSLITIL